MKQLKWRCGRVAIATRTLGLQGCETAAGGNGAWRKCQASPERAGSAADSTYGRCDRVARWQRSEHYKRKGRASGKAPPDKGGSPVCLSAQQRRQIGEPTNDEQRAGCRVSDQWALTRLPAR